MSIKKISVRSIVMSGLLIAAAVILGGPLSFNVTVTQKVNFMAVPGIFASFALGPVYGFIVGFLGDLVKSFVLPTGGYVPLFSLTAALMAVTPALLSIPLAKLFRASRENALILFPCILLSQILFSSIANTLTLVWLTGNAFWVLLPSRLFSLALSPLYAVACALLLRICHKVSPPSASRPPHR